MPLRLLIVLAFATLAVAPAHAQTPTTMDPEATIVGTLLEAEGTVSLAMPGTEPRALKLNDPVHLNDVIETGAGSRAFILLIDDTELTLGENAQLTVDEYIFDEENTAANKGRYSILRGAFLYTSGLLAKKENPDVAVNTPFGAIGIRGTSFWGGDIDGEYGVLVTEGRVNVQTERGRIFLEKGQGTSLRNKTSIPARPATWTEEKTNRAVKTIALKNTQLVRERISQRAEAQKQARLKHREFIHQRIERLKQQGGDRKPLRRIENAPRLPEKPATANPAGRGDINNPLAPEKPQNAPADIKGKGADAGPAAPKVELPTLDKNGVKEETLRQRQPVTRQPRHPRPEQPSGSRANSAL